MQGGLLPYASGFMAFEVIIEVQGRRRGATAMIAMIMRLCLF